MENYLNQEEEHWDDQIPDEADYIALAYKALPEDEFIEMFGDEWFRIMNNIIPVQSSSYEDSVIEDVPF